MPKHPTVVFDDENPEWTADDFARARPIAEFPELAAAFPKARGRPRGSTKPQPKQQIALRVDADVLARYNAAGSGWQTRMNEALRAALAKDGGAAGRG